MSGRSAVARRRAALAFSGLVVLAACGGQGPTTPTSPTTPAPSQVDNVVPLQVGSGPADNTVNGLYASVTICVPGTSRCQTIDGVEVDTGSEGLRLLSSEVSLSLPPVSDGSGRSLGNCGSFADKSYTWGPVVTADVQMAGEKAASVPIQLVGEAGFPDAPSACSNGGTAANVVSSLSARGLLGIGVFRQDCGPACSGAAPEAPAIYFGCAGSACSPTTVPLSSQLQNPVWMFPQDNNGLVVQLPAVPPEGTPTLSGSLIFGIGTQANNPLGSARVYTTDVQGNLTTTFGGRAYSSSYLDTGSNGLFFLDSSTIGLPPCPRPDSDFSCPSSTLDYAATNTGANGASGQVTFSVANAESLFRTGNNALGTLGGPDTGEFDWGLPFFLGRTTFVAIEGQATPGGTGPYWAY
jgi:Protein of unknown function (DUF3443)